MLRRCRWAYWLDRRWFRRRPCRPRRVSIDMLVFGGKHLSSDIWLIFIFSLNYLISRFSRDWLYKNIIQSDISNSQQNKPMTYFCVRRVNPNTRVRTFRFFSVRTISCVLSLLIRERIIQHTIWGRCGGARWPSLHAWRRTLRVLMRATKWWASRRPTSINSFRPRAMERWKKTCMRILAFPRIYIHTMYTFICSHTHDVCIHLLRCYTTECEERGLHRRQQHHPRRSSETGNTFSSLCTYCAGQLCVDNLDGWFSHYLTDVHRMVHLLMDKRKCLITKIVHSNCVSRNWVEWLSSTMKYNVLWPLSIGRVQ